MNAKVHTPLTESQLDGLACRRCSRSFCSPGSLSSPSGHADDGRLLFVCSGGWGCSAADSQPAATGNPLSPDVDVVCGDCGKRLHGWSYRPMFVQCDDCADAEERGGADPAAQLRAQRYADEVTRRVVDALEASQTPVPELLETTGISVHRLARVRDGADCFTVSEVVCLALATGVSIRAMFGPVDDSEVAR